jgi:hypothetical protein
MRHIPMLLLGAMLAPAAGLAQETPTDRLADVLPAEVAGQVLERVEDARTAGLPARAVSTLALEGVAKGRSAAEVLRAVEALATDMSTARDAIAGAERAPEGGEVEAATTIMRMGVDGSAVGELAQEQPSGRTLAVPLLVLGSLVDRGLSPAVAIAAVRDRLSAGATDGELLGDVADAGRSLGPGVMPADRGVAMQQGFTGVQLPIAGVPASIPGNAGHRPGGI